MENKYTIWLHNEYFGWIDGLGHINVDDWKVDSVDNSIEIAVQRGIELYMPEIYNYVKPTVYIRG